MVNISNIRIINFKRPRQTRQQIKKVYQIVTLCRCVSLQEPVPANDNLLKKIDTDLRKEKFTDVALLMEQSLEFLLYRMEIRNLNKSSFDIMRMRDHNQWIEARDRILICTMVLNDFLVSKKVSKIVLQEDFKDFSLLSCCFQPDHEKFKKIQNLLLIQFPYAIRMFTKEEFKYSPFFHHLRKTKKHWGYDELGYQQKKFQNFKNLNDSDSQNNEQSIEDIENYPLIIIQPELITLRLQLFKRHFTPQKPSFGTLLKIQKKLFLFEGSQDYQYLLENSKNLTIKLLLNIPNGIVETYYNFIQQYIPYWNDNIPEKRKKNQIVSMPNIKQLSQILEQGVRNTRLILLPDEGVDGVTADQGIYCNINSLLLRNRLNYTHGFQIRMINQLLVTGLCIVILHELSHYLIRKLNLIKDSSKSFIVSQNSLELEKQTEVMELVGNYHKSFKENLQKLDAQIHKKYFQLQRAVFNHILTTISNYFNTQAWQAINYSLQEKEPNSSEPQRQFLFGQVIQYYLESIQQQSNIRRMYDELKVNQGWQNEVNIYFKKKLKHVYSQLVLTFKNFPKNQQKFERLDERDFQEKINLIKINYGRKEFLKESLKEQFIIDSHTFSVLEAQIVAKVSQNKFLCTNMVSFQQKCADYFGKIENIELTYLLKYHLQDYIQFYLRLKSNSFRYVKQAQSGWIMQSRLFCNLKKDSYIYSKDYKLLQTLGECPDSKKCLHSRSLFGDDIHDTVSPRFRASLSQIGYRESSPELRFKRGNESGSAK